MKPTRDAAPPLWIWGASAALALTLLGATLPSFVAAHSAGQVRETWRDAIVRDFVADPSADRGPLRVIAFGDSALVRATLDPPDQTYTVRETEQLSLHLLPVGYPSALFDRVLRGVDLALAAAPDVLMIDAWLIDYPVDAAAAARLQSFAAEGSLRAGVEQLFEQPSLVLEHQAFLFDRLSREPVAEPQQRTGPPAKRPVRRRGRFKRTDRPRLLGEYERRWTERAVAEIDPTMRRAIEILLERSAAKGIHVVFFEIPRGAEMEALPGMRLKRKVTRALLRQYVAQGRAAFFEFSGELSDEETIDYIHFTEVGRERYLSWLIPQLGALGRAREGNS